MSLTTTRLGRLRVTLTGKSARTMAEEIGMPVRRLRALEIGDGKPTDAERKAIADALGCEPWEAGI